jgi:hypothetical protein
MGITHERKVPIITEKLTRRDDCQNAPREFKAASGPPHSKAHEKGRHVGSDLFRSFDFAC